MTQVTDNPDGTYTKRINTEDARTALVDALTDVMHVQASEGQLEGNPHEAFDLALPGAQMHFRAEQDGEDGCVIDITGDTSPSAGLHLEQDEGGSYYIALHGGERCSTFYENRYRAEEALLEKKREYAGY